VRLVPAAKQLECADGTWSQAAWNEDQIVPLCHQWNLQVRLSPSSPTALLVGALILSTDGSSFGLPADGRSILLEPGETVTFDARRETFRGTPPLDTRDQILVFGTQEQNPVPWDLLTETAGARGVRGSGGTLYRALDRYLRPGTRGTQREEDEGELSTWTMSALGIRVEANARFLAAVSSAPGVRSREYTLASFDVRPYLPDDEKTALHRVLMEADWLARASVEDGFSYKQHDWSQPSDAANLAAGIDCSRAIWFAFTRSNLPYNRRDRYLTTAMMVGPDSWMNDQFDACPVAEPPRLGDLLVYRSAQRGDGHVVMVVDSGKRIAWGSHGWDGAAKDSEYAVEPDTGVEYQRIKYKQDWARWDREDMQRVACWRYRRFAEEAAVGRGEPGSAALEGACDPRECRN